VILSTHNINDGGYDMSIVKFNPFGGNSPFERELSRFFNEVFPVRESGESVVQGWRPSVDVHENDEGYTVEVELPGVNREDVHITYQDGTLKIEGERRYQEESEDRNVHRRERFFGRFTRSFSFPGTVDGEKISATQKDGVLTVSIPKAEQARARQIDIS